MKLYFQKIIPFILLTLLPYLSYSAVTLPYFCGFEDHEDLSEWIFKPAMQSPNKWVVGSAMKSMGDKGLYVSADGGNTAGYENVSCGIAAYIALDFEVNEKYNISFDWRMRVASGDSLIVAVITDVTADIIAVESEIIPNFLKEAYRDGNAYGFESSDSWQNFTFQVTGPRRQQESRLVFYWVNNSRVNYSPGACIDNIQIVKEGVCDEPDSVRVESTNSFHDELVWDGQADSYDLIYKNYYVDKWDTVRNIVGNSYPILNFDSGVYTFLIRSNCGSDYSAWAIYHNIFISRERGECLNFTDLYSDNVYATSGSFGNPYRDEGIVDFGFNSNKSCHTLHYMPEEYDPYTGYLLKTVPEGEIVSVRLGNWGTQAKAESITYSYAVDKSNEILLMKYAVILQDAGHFAHQQPKFRLEILDKDGYLIDRECGEISFYAKEEVGWHTYRGSSTPVRWKDWTQIGLSLQNYLGDTVKIRLTTYDCSESGHFGYAYFTLNCFPSEITGLTCGAHSVDSISAPEGFKYEWTKLNEPTPILSYDRVLQIPNSNDVGTYVCKIISLENEKCSFELQASLKPQYPVADGTYTLKREDCTNRVYFTDKSYVTVEEEITDREIETFFWDFGDGNTSDEKNPIHEYEKPGIYNIQLTAGIVNNLCTHTWDTIVEVFPIGNSSSTVYDTICQGGYVNFFGRRIYEHTDNKFETLIKEGCDSVIYLDLTVLPIYNILIHDTICYGETYELNGEEYTTTNEYTQVLTSVITDCDSIIRLELLVLPEIIFTLNTIPVTEGNDGAIIIENAPDDYTYTINGIENGSLENLSSGEYTIILIVEYENKICHSQPQTIEIARECLIVEAETSSLNYCPDDNSEVVIPYTIHQGGIDRYSITFTSEGNLAGFENIESQASNAANTFVFPIPEAVTPGQYTVVVDFPGQACEVDALQIPFTIYYSAGIISQRWNDVLAVKSPLYNGGYSFSYYQWYKDNTPLSGENKSYLFEPAGLDLNSIYTVELIRMGETESVMSCGVNPEALDVDFQLQDNTASAGGSYRMTSSQNGSARIYSLTGVIISEQHFSTGINNIKAPDVQGYYILQIKFQDNTEKTFQINVGN